MRSSTRPPPELAPSGPIFHGRLLTSVAPPCPPTSPLGPAPPANGLRFPKDAPVLQHQQRRYRAGPARATWNWRHRNSANHAGTGGRYTRYQGFAHAGSSAPPQSARIILFCYTPHTRPSAASSATTALTINFTNHRVLSQRSLIYPYTVAERVRPPFCASL